MEHLIEQLEKATGPDRKIDYDIANYIFLDAESDAPEYSASIEAALTLLPVHISFELTSSAASTFTRARLWDWRRGPLMSDPDNEWKAEGNQPLPISICIAALKARAAS